MRGNEDKSKSKAEDGRREVRVEEVPFATEQDQQAPLRMRCQGTQTAASVQDLRVRQVQV